MIRATGPAALLFAAFVGATLLPAQDVQDRVDKIFDRIEETRGASLWEGIRQLEDLGRGSNDAVRRGLTRSDAFVRLAVAKVLYTRELREESLDALSKVIAGKNLAAKRAAADVAATLVGGDKTLSAKEKQAIATDFEKQAQASDDAIAQVSLWRAVWNLTGVMGPVRSIRRIYGESDKREVKEEAALALAEMDRFLDAKATLVEMAKEPSDHGRMAKAYLKLNELTEDLARKPATQSKYDFRQIEEAIDTLKANYYDDAKIVPEKLLEAAVRGACASLDPYTVYMDEASIKQLRDEDLKGLYGGIGARVSMRKDKGENRWLTIEEPIFSGPAYRAGLRSNDRIIEVEGEITVNRELSDLVRKLRGKPNTVVTFKVLRRGWTKEQEYKIVREEIQMETTMHRMLPGGLGYIRMTTFGDQDIALVEGAIKEMKGMKALVFDLRGNTGGYLRTAQKIASYFLAKDDVIVTTKARGVEQDKRLADGHHLTDVPMVMLVDEGSASASEILAGALQDHKRATLIGEKTFGKGSVQDLKFMKTTDEKAAIKVTIAKWYLPSGRTVEKEKHADSGIVPDIKAAIPERDFWKDAEFERLRAGDEVDKYLKDIEDKELFKKIAESDHGDLALYPKFDPLYESLKTKASKDEVRELV
ncbi:MAG TPA: S41 family peptidase, partial [Planctomycetota bacterium]|nr:S41 family peptidase [Planctomycetota bacterium]